MSDFTYRILRVDLTTKSISEFTVDPETSRRFLGGMGLGAKLLFDEMPEKVDPFAPENTLVFTTSPLVGTKAPGCGGFSLNFFGPITKQFTSSQAQGKWGARLRFAGWDGLIVTGASEEWVYLAITDDGVEIREAEKYVGLNTWETEDAIKEDTGLSRSSVACIGPAGENLVQFALVESDQGHVCATNGAGAIMGSKKLKAILVHGAGKPVVADDKTLKEMRADWVDECVRGFRESGSTTVADTWGTIGSMRMNQEVGIIPMYNYRMTDYELEYPDPDPYSAQVLREPCEYRRDPCYSCGFHHCGKMTLPSGKFKGTVVDEPEYEGMAAFTYNLGGKDPIMAIYLNNLCDLLGLDVKEMAYVIGLAMECYEEGLITTEDTDGLELKWGDTDVMLQLVQDIAYRRGIGNLLANGVRDAAEAIGGRALDFGVYTKGGITPNVVNMRYAGKGAIMGWSVSDIGTACGFSYPYNVEECLALCNNLMFCSEETLLKALNAASGWDIDIEEWKTTSQRLDTFLRVNNLLHGMTREDDKVSKRFKQPMESGPAKDVEMPTDEELRAMQDGYYQAMGWDVETTRPLPKTLKKHGFDEFIGMLWSDEELATLETAN